MSTSLNSIDKNIKIAKRISEIAFKFRLLHLCMIFYWVELNHDCWFNLFFLLQS